jgi:hypothetical protein
MFFEGDVLPATLGGINVERLRELLHGWPQFVAALAVLLMSLAS